MPRGPALKGVRPTVRFANRLRARHHHAFAQRTPVGRGRARRMADGARPPGCRPGGCLRPSATRRDPQGRSVTDVMLHQMSSTGVPHRGNAVACVSSARACGWRSTRAGARGGGAVARGRRPRRSRPGASAPPARTAGRHSRAETPPACPARRGPIRQSLNHRSLQTTQRYLHGDLAMVGDAIDRLPPLLAAGANYERE